MTIKAAPPVPPQLNGRHRHTYEAIFRHPAAHNLEWHDVKSLLEAMAEVTEGHGGSIHARRNGQVLDMHAPKHKDVATIDQLMAIRHFIERSETPETPAAETGLHLLVVIDHHEAKVYRTDLRGSEPQKLVPYDPHGFRSHLHSQAMETDGHRKPERKSFYEGIAATLRGAERIVIFGSGTGESSAMDQLVADLKKHHADIAARIAAAVVVDAHHETESQLLARARQF